MKIKIKSYIIISILILSGLIINFNFDLNTIGSENDSGAIREIEPEPLSGEDFNWSKIEVISEPIVGQNNNMNRSDVPAVAIENDKIYVAWTDYSDMNGAGADADIFFRYFNGSGWSEIQVISEPVLGQNFNIGESWWPEIAVENGNIYVVWIDKTDTNSAGEDLDIFCRCNLTGSDWEDIQVISEPVFGKDSNINYSYHPTMAVEDGKIYVAWSDNTTINNAGSDVDIFFRCNLSGKCWEPIQVISEPIENSNTNPYFSGYASIAVENGKIYAVWHDCYNTNGAGFDLDIFYRCNLTGMNWESIQVISEPVSGQDFNTGDSWWPAMTVENGKIYVVWNDDNNTNGAGPDDDIFFRCNISGLGWEGIQVVSEPVPGQDLNIGISPHADYPPEITVEKGNIFIVWCDTNNTNGAGSDSDIFYRCNITGLGWEDIEVISEPVFGQNINTDDSGLPTIVVNRRIYVVWKDKNNTNGAGTDWDIFYRSKYFKLLLSLPNVTPTSGNTGTYFNFTVRYTHQYNISPIKIIVNISGMEYPIFETDISDTNYLDGKDYYFNITHLDIGAHKYQFYASDGKYDMFTSFVEQPIVYNTPPNITTEDNLTAIEDLYYEVSYEYEDIDIANVGQVGYWNFSTNASWLAFNPVTALLNGTPTNDDVGDYWVNITINDTMEVDFVNFTLTVIDVNDDPIITTPKVEITYEDELYEVDYNATDIDSPLDNQIWYLGTNASSWLNINQDTGVISGTPINDDIGSYWVNVSVNDTEGGFDFTNFTLIVLNVNDRPEIITEDTTAVIVDELYFVDYEAFDIDPGPQDFKWSLNTNATWLKINSNTGVLNGTPALDDLGWYNVNITVDDNCGGLDWHEFILTVIKENLPPNITTEDVLSATGDELYEVDYDATDVDTPLDKLRWSLNTNASWLNIDKNTGLLSGTPALEDLGKYWVNVTVTDEVGAFDFHNFTLTVYLTPNLPPRITTEDIRYAVVGEEYSVDYEAEDDRTPVDKLRWFIKSNAS